MANTQDALCVRSFLALCGEAPLSTPHVAQAAADGRPADVLIVGPPKAVPVWGREYRRHRPDFDVEVLPLVGRDGGPVGKNPSVAKKAEAAQSNALRQAVAFGTTAAAIAGTVPALLPHLEKLKNRAEEFAALTGTAPIIKGLLAEAKFTATTTSPPAQL
jgi:hypothetical protein